MSYFAPYWRLLTVSASSLGSPGYLQNRFCQAHWSIMHWHQRAYFHFNNTEIFLLLRGFFFPLSSQILVTEWKRYGDDQTAVCFRSRLLCLSVRAAPERVREWEGSMTGGTFSKTTPNHSLFPVPPRAPERHVTIQHCLSRYPTAAHGSNNEPAPHVLSPVIFTMSCCSASKSLATFLKKKKSRVVLFTQCETCRGICSALLVLLCDPEKLNRKNSLWNHTCLWCSHVDAFRARTSGGESTSYVRWQMIYILQAEQQGLNQKMHMCNKFSITARLNFPCRQGKLRDVHVADW